MILFSLSFLLMTFIIARLARYARAPMTKMIQTVWMMLKAKFMCSSPLKSIIDEMTIAANPAMIGMCFFIALKVSISFSLSFMMRIFERYSLYSVVSISSSSITAIFERVAICSSAGFVLSAFMKLSL